MLCRSNRYIAIRIVDPGAEASIARSISVMIARFLAVEPLGLLKTVPALGV